MVDYFQLGLCDQKRPYGIKCSVNDPEVMSSNPG